LGTPVVQFPAVSQFASAAPVHRSAASATEPPRQGVNCTSIAIGSAM